jgi:hypothetical protein
MASDTAEYIRGIRHATRLIDLLEVLDTHTLTHGMAQVNMALNEGRLDYAIGIVDGLLFEASIPWWSK